MSPDSLLDSYHIDEDQSIVLLNDEPEDEHNIADDGDNHFEVFQLCKDGLDDPSMGGFTPKDSKKDSGVADCEEIGKILLEFSACSPSLISSSDSYMTSITSLTDSCSSLSKESSPEFSEPSEILDIPNDTEDLGMTIVSGEKQHHIATSKLTELINQLETDREYRKNPKVSDHDNNNDGECDSRKSSIDSEFTEQEKRKLRKASSLKSYRTPPGTMQRRKIVR